MRTIGLKPGDRVLVIERRGEQELVHNALVVWISMEEIFAGANGEMLICAAMVRPDGGQWGQRLIDADHVGGLTMIEAIHVSHPHWIEGRAKLGYEELPEQSGVCRFCGCTEHRACEGGCGWLLSDRTVCNARSCVEKLRDELTKDGVTLWAEKGDEPC